MQKIFLMHIAQTIASLFSPPLIQLPLTLSFLITAKIRYNASHFSSADINIPVAHSFIRGFYDNSRSCLGGSPKRGQIHPIQSPNPHP